MPTYEFICKDCAKPCEQFLAVEKRDKPANCQQCQGENLQRLISGGNGPPIFKGEGFYSTDYGKKEGRGR